MYDAKIITSVGSFIKLMDVVITQQALSNVIDCKY